MKKTIIISFLSMITFIVNAQSFEETQQWIASNASAKNYTKVNQQVFHSESKKLIYFIKVLEYPSGGHTFISFVFDPKKASSISIDKQKDSDGGHNLTLWFSESTNVHSVSIPDTPPYTGTRLSNDYIERLEVKEGGKKRGTEIYLSCSMEQIKSVENAYIHLFKTLGYTIKDGDKMF
jgi:hypothetical protein